MKGEQILGDRLIFSDGTTEYVRSWLSDGALTPGEIRFAPKDITWVIFVGDKVSHATTNVGLAEIEVY